MIPSRFDNASARSCKVSRNDTLLHRNEKHISCTTISIWNTIEFNLQGEHNMSIHFHYVSLCPTRYMPLLLPLNGSSKAPPMPQHCESKENSQHCRATGNWLPNVKGTKFDMVNTHTFQSWKKRCNRRAGLENFSQHRMTFSTRLLQRSVFPSRRVIFASAFACLLQGQAMWNPSTIRRHVNTRLICQQCPANMSSKARVAESVQTCAVPTLRNSRKLPNCKYFES